MPRNVRTVIIVVGCVAVIMALILGLHVGGPTVLRYGLYSQLIGAFIGGFLAMIAVNYRVRRNEDMEPWLGRERLAWTLIGAGCVMWGIGECFWRYFLAQGLNPFPSQADIGYSSLPPLIFIGLVLQPSSGMRRGRVLVLLDSLISMGAILAIAWFLLLGSLAQTPFLQDLGKFLSLWYPTSDMALLSCVVFLLIRGQGRVYQANARRISLLVVGMGLCIFATSDFIFNIQQNAGTYVDGTWVDLGWPFGMMIIGVAAYSRRFLPRTSNEAIEQRMRRQSERSGFGLAQIVPYVLLAILFIVLAVNVLSSDPAQSSIRPVLVFTTLVVVALLVLRQILTQLDNERLTRRQTVALDRLEVANSRVEEQARMIAERNAALEEGIAHLKEVQAQLANGNLRARARLVGGDLLPLAGSLNLLADRLSRFEQLDQYTLRLSRALTELSMTLEQYRVGTRFVAPASCNEFPEIQRLLLAMGLRSAAPDQRNVSHPLNASPSPAAQPQAAFSAVGRFASQPLTPSQFMAPRTPSLDTPSSTPRVSPDAPGAPDTSGVQEPGAISRRRVPAKMEAEDVSSLQQGL